MASPARSIDPELLDAAELDLGELELNLREMAMLNRLPGGVADSVRAVSSLLDGRADATVLDIGAGSGDFARRLLRQHTAQVLVWDSRDEVLAIARRNLANTNHVKFLKADVRALPLSDDAVDVAHASLLLHHLDPEDAVLALREMARVSRAGVVLNDLRRGRLALLMTAAPVLAFTRGRYTRNDGILSARRAYTLPELDAMAAEAGLRVVRRTAAWWPRVTTIYR
jgi:ubiquinone/menaquinone biosynthesis C-methylase UbiE